MSEKVDPRLATRFLAAYGLEANVPTDLVVGSLLQAVLAEGPTGGMSVGAAALELERATGLRFDSLELRRCAKDPSLGITVTSHEPPFLIIATSQREEVLARLKTASAAEAAVLEEWAQRLLAEKGSPSIAVSDLVADFRHFLLKVAIQHGMETVVLAYGEQSEAVKFLSNVDADTWTELPDRAPDYRKFCREQFPTFFVQATGSRAAFVSNLLDRTFELCRLNVAPAAGKLLLDNLSGLTLYLDTNIVFRLLGIQGPPAHIDVRRVLDAARQAKAALRVTHRTLDEFESAAAHAIRSGAKFVAPEALLGLDSGLSDHEFFMGYHHLLARARLSESDLLASVRNIARTLDAFGVKIWTEKTAAVEERRSDVDALGRDLFDYYQEIQLSRPPQSRKPVSFEQAEHDAYHLTLIELLRPQNARTFGSAKFWFLTAHSALMRKARSLGPKNRPPATILVEQLHQLLRSVLPRSEAFDQTFVRSLHSPLFQAHRANYTAAMQQVATRLAQYKNLGAEHFANIVADAGFMSRVAESTAQKTDGADLSRLVDERLQAELNSEREARLTAARRAKEESTRADEALAREQRSAVALKATEDREKALAQELDDARKALLAADQRDALRAEDTKRFRRRLKLGLRIALSTVVLAGVAWLWLSWTDGSTVRGTQLNAVAVTVSAFSVAACLIWPRKMTLALAIGGIFLATVAAPAWPARRSSSPTDPPASSDPKP